MDSTTVAKLFKGVGIIIDDEVHTDEKEKRMVSTIQAAGIPVAVYDEIPDTSTIESFGNISFVILDWDFSKKIKFLDVTIGDELVKDKRRTILVFLKTLMDKIFVPVFLITGQNFSDVKATLKDAGLYSDDTPNRIMLKSKIDVFDYDSLIHCVQNWIETTPSAYVLKLWEKDAVQAKNNMFLALYGASSNWVGILLDLLKKDSKNNVNAVNHDFNNLLTNNFVGRMADENYFDIPCDNKIEVRHDELRSILQGERYIKYNKDYYSDVSYVGDLYKKENSGEYKLNIRAQCDLIRESDPYLYLISGTEIDRSKIAKQPTIKLKNNGTHNVLHLYDQEYVLDDLISYDRDKRGVFNKDIQKYNNYFLFYNGAIIEKNNHSIITCIDEKDVIEFDYKNFEIMKKSTLNDEYMLIGKIIPPYITKIQNSFSSYIVREGIMRIPEGLFSMTE